MQRLAKASAAKPSAFLGRGGDLKKTTSGRSPFLLAWRNPSAEVLKAAAARPTLYVAPVSLDYLRPMTRLLSQMEIRESGRQKQALKLAEYMRTEFAQAIRKSAQPRYQIVDAPAKDSLVLELAIVEFNPNAISGGITRRAINLLGVPGAESVVAQPLKGTIAIEGRVFDPVQKQSLYEFADKEQNRSALILSVHDYNAYSYARKIIREWAAQFEEITRTPAGGRVKDTSPYTVWLW